MNTNEKKTVRIGTALLALALLVAAPLCYAAFGQQDVSRFASEPAPTPSVESVGAVHQAKIAQQVAKAVRTTTTAQLDTADKIWGCEVRKLQAGTIGSSVLDCHWH